MFYIDGIPYLKTLNRKTYLPKGQPNGFNTLFFLYSNSIEESIQIINSTENSIRIPTYHKYYFYNMLYNGKINGKFYRFNETTNRAKLYEYITKETRILPVRSRSLSFLKKGNNFSNVFFDLVKYNEIFLKYTKKMSIPKRVNTYWSFYKSIYFSPNTNAYEKKYVLLPISTSMNFSNGKLEQLLSNPVFMLYYTMYKRPELLYDIDIDFILYSGSYILKLNPSKIEEKQIPIAREQIRRIIRIRHKKADIVLDDENIDKKESEEISTANIRELLDVKYNLIGNDNDSNTSSNEINKTITDKIQKVQSEIESNQITKQLPKEEKQQLALQEVENEINSDKELLKTLYDSSQASKTKKSAYSSERDKMLRDRQYAVNVDGITIEKLEKMETKNIPIEERNVETSLHTSNKNLYKVKYANFDHTYNTKVMKKDIINAVTMLNNKSIKLFIRDVKIEDTSDVLNYKDTYTFVLEDENKKRHTIKVDIPKFIDGSFMYLGGNKKLILRQNFLLPVVKTGPDTVQIVTNYNKMFIRRISNRSTGAIERILAQIRRNPDIMKNFIVGRGYSPNTVEMSTIEYDEFGKYFAGFDCGGTKIFFDRSEAADYAGQHSISLEKTVLSDNSETSNHLLFIGIENRNPIYLDLNTQMTTDDRSISEIIVAHLPEDQLEEFGDIKSGKRLMYNDVTIMEHSIPLICLLGFWEGISTVLRKANISYDMVDTYPKQLSPRYQAIQFKDCCIVYKDTVETSLLMNGLRIMETKEYNLIDFDNKEVYIDYFRKVYGKAAIANAIMNAYEFTIDPITLEILQDQNLPVDLVELVIYAGNLLADNKHLTEVHQSLSRVRSNEIIPAILYDALAKNYITYKNSGGTKSLSIRRDVVIEQLLKLKTVEDYSTLNPFLELERLRSVSSKGWRGVNLDRAYTLEKRSYDASMIGVMGLSSSPDSNVGMQKTLSLEPNIVSIRGYCDVRDEDHLDDLKDVNLFSPAELLIPQSVTGDDPTRTGHNVKQSKHVIPVKGGSPTLITNGADEAIQFSLSSDFCVNADQDGEVTVYDEKLQMMIVTYKDGTTRAISLKPTIVKNGGGGFYESNQLVSNYRLGDKFKKDALLAYHKDFFSSSSLNGTRLNIGVLTKIAIKSTYNSYEDAAAITHKLSEEATTEMCFLKSVVVGKNANVDFMVDVGDRISVGDPLIQYDHSQEESELNKMLAKLKDEDKETFVENSKNIKTSIHSGVIEDIKIYSTVDLEDMSPSLQKVVKRIYKRSNDRRKLLDKYDPQGKLVKCGLFFNESTEKVQPNKYGVIRGQHVEDAVLIEIYIKEEDSLGVGDKITVFTALKEVVGEVIPEGFEPYSEFRPDEEIGTFLGESSIMRRMTPSLIVTMFGNKVLVELKRALEEIYNS